MADTEKRGKGIEATLFGLHKVLIALETLTVGVNVWERKDKAGAPMASEPHLMSFMYRHMREVENPILLDIGANTGMFALLPAIKPDLTVLAFEPNPNIQKILKENIALNNISDKTTCYPFALSDHQGTASLKIPQGHTGLACLGTPLRFDTFTELEVPMETVDSIVARKKLPRVDFIKIDTEGCELFVLRGAIQTIRKFRPHILLEYWAENTVQFGYLPEELDKILAELDYSTQMISYEDCYCIPN